MPHPREAGFSLGGEFDPGFLSGRLGRLEDILNRHIRRRDEVRAEKRKLHFLSERLTDPQATPLPEQGPFMAGLQVKSWEDLF